MKQKYIQRIAYLSSAAVLFSFLALPSAGAAENPRQFNLHDFWQPDFQTLNQVRDQRVCGRNGSSPSTAVCDAHVATDAGGKLQKLSAPSGYSPAQLLAAYGLSGQASGNKIIGIVDAYDDPNIQSDLNFYSAEFGIPNLPACTGAVASSAIPCFQKSDQNGGAHYPAVNSGWDLEIALDAEAAHAVCQNCSVLLVEANSSSYNDLFAAEDRAASLGASVISNSWGGGESRSETSYDSHLNKPGIAITFSSGDSGYGVEYPAASPYVTSVGGTTLSLNSNNTRKTETAWSGAGSGCSAYETKPSWQPGGSKYSACARRTVADVSADANPNTGVAVYDSVPYSGTSGWFQVGGTSLSAQIIGAIYAQGTVPLPANAPAGSLLYQAALAPYLYDVIGGGNGFCFGSYLCTAVSGYDGPTGLGSPKGAAAF